MALFNLYLAFALALLSAGGSVAVSIYTSWFSTHPWMMWVFFAPSVICFAFAIRQWRIVHSRLVIHRAVWYGDDPEISQNKTHIVRGWVFNNSIHHEVHETDLGGHPRGEAKKLEVLYSLRDIRNKTVITKNGKTLVIPEPFSEEVL